VTVGTVLGKYRILREIGGGGMACVYEAEDQSIGRKVALKVLMLPPAVPESEKSLLIQRFQQEARAAGTLSHSNVVTLYEVGETDGVYYIAMELLTGTTVRELLRERGKIPVDEALHILLQAALCHALAKKPEERPSSAAAFVEELSAAYYGTAVVSPEARIAAPSHPVYRDKEKARMSPYSSFSSSPSRRPYWIAGALAVVLLVAGILMWYSLSPSKEQFGVRIVDVGEKATSTPAVATNYVLNDFELSPGSWQAENKGLRLERVRGGASQAAYWLKVSGVQLAAGEHAAISCLPETRDWSRFGGIISLDVLVPGTAPPDLLLTIEVEDSTGGLQAMPGEGVLLTPGRWAAITWNAGAVARDVARLRVKLLCGQTPYRGYFGIDHVRAQGTATSPAALRYKVRIGPFTDQVSLERETARLKSLGKSPFVVREGDKRYLQVGAFTTIESARRELQALVAEGYRAIRQ